MQCAIGRMSLGLAMVAGLSVAVVGCSSHHQAASTSLDHREKAVSTIADLRTDLKQADAQILTTQQSLQRLSTQQAGDLKPIYTGFNSEVFRNRLISEGMSGRSRDLANEASQHVNEWDYQARTIQNDALRQSSLDREQQARREQDDTIRSLNEVRGMYTQYIRQLDDISTYAANDLTPRGVAGLHDQVQRADQTAQDLRNRMAQLDLRLDKLATAWRTDVPLAAAASDRESAQPAGGKMPPADQPASPDRTTMPPPEIPANTPARTNGSGM